MESDLELGIVVGSTRQGRQADRVLPWLAGRARDHGAFRVQVLDLRSYPLPMLGEPSDRLGPDGQPVVAAWNEAVAGADALVFLTPEYGHSVPGVLKNAIDSLGRHRLARKPAGCVAYSAGRVAGARAVEHLAGIVVESEMVPLRSAVLVAQVQGAFAGGQPVDPGCDAALRLLLDDLAWWGAVLRAARRPREPASQIA